jgi:hypothetical protein
MVLSAEWLLTMRLKVAIFSISASTRPIEHDKERSGRSRRADRREVTADRFGWLARGNPTHYQMRTFAAFPFGILEGFLTVWVEELECYAVHTDDHP